MSHGGRTWWRAIWAALACAALCGPGGSAPGDAAPGDEPAHGYDHISHEGKVSVAGAAPIPCARCHALDRAGTVVGRPGHAACFGACHGDAPGPRRAVAPYPIADGQLRVCQVCHSPTALSRAAAGGRDRLAVRYPPYDGDPDHGLAMSHAAHRDSANEARGCATCHGAPPEPRPGAGQGGPAASGPGRAPAATSPGRAPAGAGRRGGHRPHARCAGCHLRPAGPDVPALADCAACHPPAYGPSTGPHLVRGAFAVRSAFSHASHRARGGEAGRECAPCHDAVWATAGDQVPAPSMDSCGGCHDGREAFSIVGTSCRRCHVDRTEPSATRDRLDERYSHRAHLARGAAAGADPAAGAQADRAGQREAGGAPTCAGCHQLDAAGAPLPPARDHAPCSDAGCHRDEFLAVRPRICGACHMGAEPWRPLHADRRPPRDTEFGAVFPHAGHLARTGADNAACERCHRPAEPPRDLRAGGGHAGCTGAGCHAAGGGPAPALEACGGCHQPGLVAARERARRGARHSVRARFRHAPHRAEPDGGAPVACTSCHAGVEASAGLDDLAAPGKPACVRCHDGAAAFKMTGHGCVRCHGRADPAPGP